MNWKCGNTTFLMSSLLRAESSNIDDVTALLLEAAFIVEYVLSKCLNLSKVIIPLRLACYVASQSIFFNNIMLQGRTLLIASSYE